MEKPRKKPSSRKKINPNPKEPPKASNPHAPNAAPLNPQTEALLERVQRLRRELENKLEEFYSKTGLKDSDIKVFLANSSNFSPSEWEFVKKYRAMLYAQFSQQTHYKIAEKKVAISDEPEGLSKIRKTKTLGSRKKWLPMK